jgi:hypothetical protein
MLADELITSNQTALNKVAGLQLVGALGESGASMVGMELSFGNRLG